MLFFITAPTLLIKILDTFFCPKTKGTWCKWQLDKLKGTTKYKNHISIPKWIHDVIKPIFIDLASDKLLSKCLHGETQNTNECLNSLVWQKCPKSIFVSREVLEMGIHSAVLHFNDGTNGVEKVLSFFNISSGTAMEFKNNKIDCKRVRQMDRKLSDVVKRRRKTLRTIKQGYQDKENDTEKPAYIKGGF